MAVEELLSNIYVHLMKSGVPVEQLISGLGDSNLDISWEKVGKAAGITLLALIAFWGLGELLERQYDERANDYEDS